MASPSFPFGAARAPNVSTLLAAAIATGAGAAVPGTAGAKTFQATGVTSAGAGSVTIAVQGSNDNANWDTIGSITLTLSTTAASDSFTSDDRYGFLRGNVTAISGTNAAASLTMGV